MSTPISRNDAETFAKEKKHLWVPIIRRERPAVTEHNRLPGAPVLVKNLRPVFGGDGAHGLNLRREHRAAAIGRWMNLPMPANEQRLVLSNESQEGNNSVTASRSSKRTGRWQFSRSTARFVGVSVAAIHLVERTSPHVHD